MMNLTMHQDDLVADLGQTFLLGLGHSGVAVEDLGILEEDLAGDLMLLDVRLGGVNNSDHHAESINQLLVIPLHDICKDMKDFSRLVVQKKMKEKKKKSRKNRKGK